jgi:hypothetical protein
MVLYRHHNITAIEITVPYCTVWLFIATIMVETIRLKLTVVILGIYFSLRNLYRQIERLARSRS